MLKNVLVLVDKKLDLPLDPFVGEKDAIIQMLNECYDYRGEIYGDLIPGYFENPDDYDLYDCGTFDNLRSFCHGNPFDCNCLPRNLGCMSDLLRSYKNGN